MEKSLPSSRAKPAALLALIAILALGIFLRAWPSDGFHGVGYDEHIYDTYVGMAAKEPLCSYSNVIHAYLLSQAKRAEAVVPPTRVGFLWPASVLAKFAQLKPLVALHVLSILASSALLVASAAIGYRSGGWTRMLVLSALMALAPLQIHLAQRSLVDGYFAFWAVLCAWCLWERLQVTGARGWLAGYGVSLFILVLTKENAAFVFLALICVLGVFMSFGFARTDLPLLLVTIAAPLAAVVLLSALVGGIGEWIAFYTMFAAKSRMGDYAVRFQDGAWYRYLIDCTLLSPCIVALVFGRIFQIGREAKADIFWAVFLGFSYAFMSSVSYGMSLRFAAYWDMPLRWLAASQLILLANRFVRSRPSLVLVLSVLIIAAIDLTQYWHYFVQSGIYDPVSFQLLHASGLIK